MSDEAATPTGGAEVAARPEASAEPKSVHERLKSAIFDQPQTAFEGVAPSMGDAETDEAEPVKEPVKPQETEDEPAEDAQEEQAEVEFSSLEELAEALGWDLDKLLNLNAKTKIDGKEGTRQLRDLIKSHQLEGHLNQKLMTHAEERKAFEAEAQRKTLEIQERTQYMQHAQALAERLLHAEFAATDWDTLRATDPVTYNSKVVEFQDRQRGIQQLASMLGQENQRQQAEAAKQQQAYFQEQTQLLESKVPEWATKAAREKALTDMAPVFEEAYGITKDELGSVVDHRQLLIARDAYKWQQLQKQKPAITNKVKAAPKLLKPGTTQSKAAQNNLQLQQDRARLKSTGKIGDAKPVLKKLLFG